jgi:malonyl CoA-acyl carrier protein transacylase/NAD(P)-dependent dehydrogenase (short-subunit alcohol dehydrogenase family)
MARETYENEPVFRSEVDRCAELLDPALGLDLRTLLYPEKGAIDFAEQELAKTQFAQPALFVIEYAMAKLWGAWGIHPQAMVGHSIGEYVAACLAGVLSLEDALQLVATRGRLMQSMPAGSMLAVLHPEDELLKLLEASDEISLAASNAPSASVVAGPAWAIEAFEAKLESHGIPCRPLHTSHAFHSAMMDPMLEDFRQALGAVKLSPPRERYLSNLTGTWITAADATSPDYWLMHLRKTVRFSENVATLLADPHLLLLEVGPGRTLSSLLIQHPARQNDQPVLASLPHPKNDAMSDLQFVMTTAGRLWLEGKPLHWDAFYAKERRRRTPLPTYPFDHESYEVEVEARSPHQAGVSRSKILDISQWFHYQSWRRSQLWPMPPIPGADGSCLVFLDTCGVGDGIAERMRAADWDVLTVKEGLAYSFDESHCFTIRPGEQEDYLALLDELARQQRAPTAVFHLWGVTSESREDFSELEIHEEYLARGFMSLFYLAPAISQQFGSKNIRLAVITSDIYNVADDTIAVPTKAAVVGPSRAMRAECPNIACRTIDITTATTALPTARMADNLIAELFSEPTDEAIAYRGANRWLQAFEPLMVECPTLSPELKRGGTYLITGGMGGIGIVLAEAIATIVPANLALFSRATFPPREEWEELQHGSDLTADKARRLLRMEALGSRVMVLSADVSDLAQMTEMKVQVQAEFGPVTGVIHSAGIAGAGIMLLKSKAQMMEVLLPKIKGTLVLDHLFKDTSLDFFILCSSLNSFLGQGGVSDYIGANAFLDAFANSRRKSLSPPLSVQWDSWEDVGMIASYYAAQREPVEEPLTHALFASRFKNEKTHTYVVHLDPEKHWVVGDHILMGSPTLVGTTHLQFALSAFGLANGEGPVEMRDVLFLVPLTMKNESTREVHVVLEETDGHFWDFTIKSRKTNSQWQTHAIGKVGHNRDASSTMHDVPAIFDRCRPANLPSNGPSIQRNGDIPFLSFGKRWSNMDAWNFGTDEALGQFRLAPEFIQDLNVYDLHPAIMDTATSFAIFKAGTPNSQYLPFAYNRVRISDKLPDKLYSHARFEKGDAFISLNLTLLDEHGRQLVQIDGYEVHKISEEMVTGGNPDLIGAEAEVDRLAAPKSHIPKNAKAGARIHSSDGIEVLRRLLNLNHLSQVAVACRPLDAVRLELEEVFGVRAQPGKTTEQKTQKMHARPTLASDFLAPRNDLELALAEIWQSTLGIGGIGVYDDFVELGGNSLLGIQVASRIRSEFEIELSIAAFYKNPTIARLAESILKTLHEGLSESELASALDEIEAQNALGTELHP